VGWTKSTSVADNRVFPADPDIAAVGDPMRLPRNDVVFRLWQCDKENHGWREGPPLTVPCQSFDLLTGPSPSRQNQLRTKKEYPHCDAGARSSIRTLAALKRPSTQKAAEARSSG
jgi:hypothetical protein